MSTTPDAVQSVDIELVGGPFDGREFFMPSGEDGLPLDRLRLPDPVGPGLADFAWADDGRVEQEPVAMFTYRRDAYAEARGRWIYRPER